MSLKSRYFREYPLTRLMTLVKLIQKLEQPDDTGFANHIVPNDQNSETPFLLFKALVQARSGEAAHASVAETSKHQGLRHDDNVWSGSGVSRGQRRMIMMV